MNATSVRHLSQMAQEGDQEALIWGETMEMIDVTEAVLALARWTPGASTDRIAGRGHISLAPEVLELFLYPVLPLLFCKLTIQDRSWIFFFGGGGAVVCVCVCVCVRLP